MNRRSVAILTVALAGLVGAETYYIYDLTQKVDRLEAKLPAAMAEPTFRSGLSSDADSDPSTWDPFSAMRQMQDEMNRLFGDSFSQFYASPRFGDLVRPSLATPDVDLREEKDRYVVKADIPGAEDTNVGVTLKGRTLRIDAEAKEEKQEEADSGHLLRHERMAGHFERTLTLPGPVDTAAMHSQYEDGMLTVTIPKSTA
jgi:HSP20 family protein